MKKTLTFVSILFLNFCFGQNFSDTKGVLEISNTGQATYTLPIAMPPSIKDVAPVINLTYASGVKGGIAGQGWSINTISSISRIATRKDIDGYVDGVDFDSDDKLALDGQRLLWKSGSYWGNGSVYETEYKSNTKIELKVEGSIKYFITYSPDGSRSWYGSVGNGNYPNAVSENSWYIVRHEDVHGNYITYEYQNFTYNNTNQFYIKTIKFSGNQTQSINQTNKIIFNYDDAQRVERDYINGKPSYASKILDNIEVTTNDVLFRRYEITRASDNLGYERVTRIKEINGFNESSNPVEFTYDVTQNNTSRVIKPFDNNLSFQNVKFAADFNGDGRMDFIANDKLYKDIFEDNAMPSIIVPENASFTATTVADGKLNQSQSLVCVNYDATNTEFKVYNLEGNQFVYKYSKNIQINRNTVNTFVNNTGSTYGLACAGYYQNYFPPNAQNTDVSFKEGDFNGDGISEVLIKVIKTDNLIENNAVVPTPSPWPNPFDPNLCNLTNTPTKTIFYYLLDLNSTGSSYGYRSLGETYNYLENISQISDFSGDGKSDILSMDGTTYYVLTFKETPNTPLELDVIGFGGFPGYSAARQMLLGDYNGDGKTDIMMPNSNGCSGCNSWAVYFSNPLPSIGEFFVKENFTIDEYLPVYSLDTQTHFNSYFAMDVNKDGKTDWVRFYRKIYKPYMTINDHDTEWSVSVYTNYIGKVGSSGFVVSYYSGEFNSDSPDLPVPIVGNYRYKGTNSDLVVVRNSYDYIEYYQFEKNFIKDNRLISVSESNGNIKQGIFYSQMIASDSALGDASNDIYSSTNTATYPFIEIIKNPDNYLVSKLTATVNGNSKHQDFKYRSLVFNFNYGQVGFKRTARSSWYLQASDPKIWTIQENDISLRGANTKTWTNKNGLSVFATVPDNLISTKTNSFDTYTNPTTKVYNVLLNQQISKDEITGVKIEQNFTYDGTADSPSYYGLKTQTITKYFNGNALQGTSTVSTDINDYENNPGGTGNGYFIGRPKRVSTSNTILGSGGSDTRTTDEKYFYLNSNLTRVEKKGHNTDTLIEEMSYDPLGNLLTKTISMPTSIPPVAARTTIDVYDTSKRFVKTKTDHQGFVSSFEYNDLGQVLKSTNHLGVINDFNYDNWGKLIENKTTGISTTQKITTTTYSKNNDGGYYVVEENTSGTNEINITRYDVLGRVMQKTIKAFESDIFLSTSIEYDGLGRKMREWEPYFNTPNKKTEYVYDDLSRLTKVTYPTGKIQNISYTGLMTLSDDDGRITTTTLDAMGNKIQTTDEGGTINFTYYASGELKSSGYEANNIQIGIDGWGNKISLNDPNAGNYTYDYDGFGQLIQETNPKGSTTYEYDSFGKIKKKIIDGDGADFIIDYTYNDFGQLTREESKNSVNATIDSFDYGYDYLHRLITTTENNNGLEHIKTISYDEHGRILTENNSTREKASNFSSSFLNKYFYSGWNGMMYKITDSNDAILWKLNTANEQMQPKEIILGNGIQITNTYTPDSYLSVQVHKKNQSFILSNIYDFEPKRGNLLLRYNGIITENFTYDNLDRLVSWTNQITNTIDFNGYDNKGRIGYNNKVGNVAFNSDANTGIYRKDNIRLNAEGQTYYGSLGGNQIIDYTMFKSPISINESNKGKINFEYNSHLSRMKMAYDYGLIGQSSVKEQRKTKLYSDDGNAEVIYDNVANTIKIISYVGGTAYDAVLYIEKKLDLTSNITTEKKYYLHRDYLGSVIAITNDSGNIVEKRHFDAWGNLTSITNENGVAGNIANGLQFFDRGYTSHEHLQEVRLIHMNGRLYDPMLRSFLMPDNFVQLPDNTQNYNRYAYCLNNPLKYSDPSGEELTLLAAVAIGAAVAALTYTITAALADVPFSFGGLAGATFIGAASAAVTFGIGSGAENLFANFYSRAAFQAVSHGMFQGSMAGLQGGAFWSGFAAGALSSIASSLYAGGSSYTTPGKEGVAIAGTGFNSIGDNLGDVGMIAFGTVSGGAGASLTGGNFWQGAVTGLTVSSLNHFAHKMSSDDGILAKRHLTKEERQKIGENYPDYTRYPNAEDVYEEVGGPLYEEFLANRKEYVNTCAIRLSVAFEKSNIDIGGDYFGANGKKYYTSATRIAGAINSRFISSDQGYNLSQYGIGIQFKNNTYTGSVFHVDVVYIKKGVGVFGHTLYNGYYNKFY